ncbi:MAG: gamma-glutamyltransferase, partial [Thermoanaerobaculales bacterium]|nr:gamma-glutamyltransferase [Thermoanaerobaculales bacterium]
MTDEEGASMVARRKAFDRQLFNPIALIFTAMVVSFVGVLFAEITCQEGPLPFEPAATRAGSDFGMVASGSPEASDAAVEILERGGNAVDAAVAAALMLGVADPDASGLGGMTSMVIRLADGRVRVIDGSSPTPREVDPSRLQKLAGTGIVVGHAWAAVPTTLAVLDLARTRYGTMSLATLLAASIEIAEHGHVVNPVQHIWTNHYLEEILASRFLRMTALENGTALRQPGDVVCRPELAGTLRDIARYGASTFYRGPIADLIEADMLRSGGFIRKTDLARLRVNDVYPIHTTYRGTKVFTIPPPGGGSSVIEALNILETFPDDFLAEDTIARHHVLLETFRIALADRGLAPGPVVGPLRNDGSPALSKTHAQRRADMIVPGEVIADSILYQLVDPECAPKGESTTQVSVADRWGNVVSLTQTLGRSWGSKAMTPGLGFPYNSLLESFNHDKPQCPGYLQPGILCSNDMAPTIVFARDGSLLVALGSPGSNLIPAIIANVISNLVDRGMGLEEAVAAPRVLYGGSPNLAPFIEVSTPITDADIDALEASGHPPVQRVHYPPATACAVYFGGVNAVTVDPRTGAH